MFKLIVPLLGKNSCYENANTRAAYCIKNILISPSTTNVLENLALRRHFLFSTTNRKTIQAFPAIPKHLLGVSNRFLEKQLELLPTNKIIKQFYREFNRSSVLLESSVVNETALKEKSLTKVRETKRDPFIRKQPSLYQEDYLVEENNFGNM